MDNKIIFFNTGWMDFYEGIKGKDKISGGGKYIDKHGWGGEILNFKPYKNNLYGYVQPKSQIKLENIGGKATDEKLSNVTVVWTATNPNTGGTYVVGWYKNATVYRYYQEPPTGSGRIYKNRPLGFYAKSGSADCKLLPKDERILFRLKRGEKGWIGQNSIWFAEKQPEFVKQVLDFIHHGVKPSANERKTGLPRQPDPLKRIQVEVAAVKFVTKYFTELGYSVESFEKDNLGWDLLATHGGTRLKLEVKGLSGKSILTELTPNEFGHLTSDKPNYRICIVTDALSKPRLKIFAHSTETDGWVADDGSILEFEKITSARIFCDENRK